MSKENRVSDERLAEMLEGLDGVTPGPWDTTAGLVRSIDGDEAIPIFESRDPWKKHRRTSTVMRQAWHNRRHVANCDPDTISAIITELQSLRSKPVAGVSVKPLEWEGQTAIDAFGLRWTVYVDYGREDGKECFACNCLDGTWPTMEEAKAAAEADYRQRILSTLSYSEQEPAKCECATVWAQGHTRRDCPHFNEEPQS